jgi:beta-lactamase class C
LAARPAEPVRPADPAPAAPPRRETPAAQPRPAAHSTPCAPAFVRKATDAIERYRAKTSAHGVAVAVYDEGKTCVIASGTRDGREPVRSDSAFSMGSVQKVFNATLLAYGIERGGAKLTDPAARYLTSEHGKRVAPKVPFNNVTLKDLVTHTASLPGDGDDIDDDHRPQAKEDESEKREGWNLYRDQAAPGTVIDALDAFKPAYPIGTRYAYSNLGFVLVGYSAVAIANMPYSALFNEVIVEPLGMKRTGPAACETNQDGCAVGYNAQGKPLKAIPVGLWTTADDLLLFLEANLGVLALPALQARAFERTHAPLFEKKKNAMGMGWEISGKGNHERHAKSGAGSGFSSWVAFEAKSKHGVAVLTNLQGGSEAPAALGRQILELMR